MAVKSKKAYELHAEFCKFMSNPKRIELIFLLGGREKRVEQLVGESGIRFSNVSQHLSVMKGKGIVETRRQGKNIFYRLSSGRILEACVIMRDLMIERMKRGKMK